MVSKVKADTVDVNCIFSSPATGRSPGNKLRQQGKIGVGRLRPRRNQDGLSSVSDMLSVSSSDSVSPSLSLLTVLDRRCILYHLAQV